MTIGLPSKAKSRISGYTNVFTVLLQFFLATCPLNNSYEIAAMMNGTLSTSASGGAAWTATLTPIYFKAPKDIFFLLVALLVVFGCIKFPKRSSVFLTVPFIPLNLFVAGLILSALYSLAFMPASIILMGVRGYWSVVFVYAGALYCNFKESKIYPFVTAIFALHFLLQIVQFATGVGFSVYFENRSPGLFIIPSTAGAFAILVHYFSIRFNSSTLKILSVISLVLSNSTTGLFIIVAYYLYSYRNKMKPKIIGYPIYFMTVFGIGYAIISNLGSITGRGEGASYSALARLGVLYLALSSWNNLLFGMGMGIATSQALLSGYGLAVIADNTYVGILYNAGIFPALMMLTFMMVLFRYAENKLLYFLLLGYSMTTVIFEINPVVQVILILLGAHIGRRYTLKLSEKKERGPQPIPAAMG